MDARSEQVSGSGVEGRSKLGRGHVRSMDRLVRLSWKKRISQKRREAIRAHIAEAYGYRCINRGDSLFIAAKKRDMRPVWLFMLLGNWTAIR
jgi:hypothetical protein